MRHRSRRACANYLDIIARGKEQGADSVILGCTEDALLVGPEHVDLPSIELSVCMPMLQLNSP